MNILALNIGHHASACLLKDGNISFFMEEEKTTHLKTDSFPVCVFTELKEYLKNEEIDFYVITYLKYLDLPNPVHQQFIEVLVNHIPQKHGIKLKREYYTNLDHHLLHASCAFYGSGFNESIVLVSDGGGSQESTEDGFVKQETETVYVASYPANFILKEKLFMTDKDENCSNYSMGVAFQIISEALGYAWHDAGKVMGLAAYGNDNKDIKDFFYKKVNGKGRQWISNDFYYQLAYKKDYREIQNKPFQYKADLAYKLQKQAKERTLDRINDILKENKLNNFILTGGYALNCVNNYEYIKFFPGVNFYFDPLGNDAGTALGAAKYAWHHHTKDRKIRSLTSLYLGNDCS